MKNYRVNKNTTTNPNGNKMCIRDRFYHDEIRHNHDHFHICVSTIDYSGKKVDDTYEKYRSMEIERKLEEKYKLKPNIGRNTKKGLRREELAFKKRTNTAKLNKEIIREKIDTVIKESGSFADFVTKLKDTNPPIICEPTYQSTGRISGVKFSFNGHFCTGSSLGKGYSYLAIENQILRQKRQLIPKKTWPKMATDATKTQIIAPEPTFGFSSFPISALQQDEDRTMEIEEMLRKKKKKRRTL